MNYWSSLWVYIYSNLKTVIQKNNFQMFKTNVASKGVGGMEEGQFGLAPIEDHRPSLLSSFSHYSLT
jgi:hypothetical protein